MTTIGQLAASPTNYTAADADGLYSHLEGVDAALLAAGNRCGQIVIWATEDVPDWLLVCDGSQVSKAAYPDLFAVIGNIYGGSGENFKLPYLNNGFFFRVHDNGAGTDSLAASRFDRGDGGLGDNIGTQDFDKEYSHSHGINQIGRASCRERV